MAIRAPEPKQREWHNAPEGVHRAVCVDVYLKPQVETKFGVKDFVYFTFQLDAASAGTVEIDGMNKPYIASRRESLSVHKKANLRKMAEGWRGKKFVDDDEAANFDFESFVGANAQIQIVHSEPAEDGTVYANITALLPAASGLEPLVSQDYERMKDRDNGPF